MHRRRTIGITALMAVMMLAAAALFSAGVEEYDTGTLSSGGDPALLDVQEKFDYMGPVVRKLELSSGKSVAYVDEGEEDWIPVLYVGGAGTASRAMSLTDFLRTLRGQLGLRLITVGRNGLGETEYAPDWGYDDYVKEVEEVLDHLGVDKFVGMAISGGGPYLAAIASAMPERLISIHMAAALSQSASDSWNAVNDVESIMGMLRVYPANPLQWWYLGDTSPMAVVPGFQDTANEDGTRSFFMGGQLGQEDSGEMNVERAVAEEYKRFASDVAELSHVSVPTYTYYSRDDASVGMEHAEYWSEHLNVVKARTYDHAGHAVQYRHWGQIMLDMAGFDDYLLISDDTSSMIVPEEEGAALVESGEAILGIHAWQTGERN